MTVPFTIDNSLIQKVHGATLIRRVLRDSTFPLDASVLKGNVVTGDGLWTLDCVRIADAAGALHLIAGVVAATGCEES